MLNNAKFPVRMLGVLGNIANNAKILAKDIGILEGSCLKAPDPFSALF